MQISTRLSQTSHEYIKQKKINILHNTSSGISAIQQRVRNNKIYLTKHRELEIIYKGNVT